MKQLKILGAAVVAAAALMAFVGAGTASADVLCKTNTTNECASGWRLTHITASQVGTGTLFATSGNEPIETCTGATMTGNDTEGSETHEPGGAVESITWSGCAHTKVTVAPGHLTIETRESGGVHLNTVVSSGLKWTFIFGASCTYGTGSGTSLGDLTTGEPAVLHINAVINKVEGGLVCPATFRWEATFQITGSGLWMSKK